MSAIEVKVPDIGDFKDVPVIELLVKPGDKIKKEDSLVTLESDKATMEVPSTHAGVVKELRVKIGDKVSQGSVIAVVDAESAAAAPQAQSPTPAQASTAPQASTPAQAGAQSPASDAAALKGAIAQQGAQAVRDQLSSTLASLNADLHAEVLVLGAGPGGYTAAFRAADLGKKVVLVERWPTLGGVCLNVGCIPSKALLHAAKVISEGREMAAHGIGFAAPAIDLDKLRGWQDGVVKPLTGGLSGLAKQRKVTVVPGYGRFASHREIAVDGDGAAKIVSFEQAIIAAGSEPVTLPF